MPSRNKRRYAVRDHLRSKHGYTDAKNYEIPFLEFPPFGPEIATPLHPAPHFQITPQAPNHHDDLESISATQTDAAPPGASQTTFLTFNPHMTLHNLTESYLRFLAA